MAIITVTNARNSGAGSLREAIASANSGDTVAFSSELANKTIRLDEQLVIDKDITLDGAAAPNLTLSGEDKTRILHVDYSYVDVVVRNLTFANGRAADSDPNKTQQGGAIELRGPNTLVVENSRFINNSAERGGAIHVGYGASATVVGSEFDGNDGSLANDGFSAGAISTQGGGEGAKVVNTNGDRNVGGEAFLDIRDSTFTNNKGSYGAVYTLLGGLRVEDSVFRNNEGTRGAGAIFTDGANGTERADNLGGTTLIRNVIAENNTGGGDYGGAFFLYGYSGDKYIIENTQVIGNEARRGGGIGVQSARDEDNGVELIIRDSVIADNTASSQGGGIWTNVKGGVTIEDSTFSGNRVTTPTGGGDIGGAIVLNTPESAESTITNTTFTDNYADRQSGNIWIGGAQKAQNLTITDSQFAGNRAGSRDMENTVNFPVNDGGGNVVQNANRVDNGLSNATLVDNLQIDTIPPVAEEPVAEEPVAEEPAVEEPIVEEPVAEEPTAEEPAVEEPTAEEPAVEEPTAEEPVAEEPTVEEPVAEEPTAEEPTAEEPAVEEPTAEEPAVEEPVAEEPVAEEPAVEEPAVEEPAAEEPVIEEPVADAGGGDSPDMDMSEQPTQMDPTQMEDHNGHMGMDSNGGDMEPSTVLWSDAGEWLGRVPADGEDVIIPDGMTVVLDGDTPDLGNLVVHGKVMFGETDVTLTADNVIVFGEMMAGSEGKPHTHKAEIILTGKSTDADVVLADWMGEGHAMDSGEHAGHMTNPIDSKAVIVAPGGKLELHGAEVDSWTQLDSTANAGDTSITLAESPTGWNVGDTIGIAPTDFDPLEVEERTISKIEGSTVFFDKPLEYRHYGEQQDLGNGKQLDMRAEVTNLTRNISITGSDEGESQILETDSNNPDYYARAGYGGHTMYLNDSEVKLDGVEFNGLGLSGELGRYPVHFHHTGDAEGSYVKNSSIHHSFQRGLVVHRTDNLLVEGNTTFDTMSHSYYIEDGVETGNQFVNNLAVLPRRTAEDFRIDNEKKSPERPSGFWITNQTNAFEGNHVAGVLGGQGFWFQDPDKKSGTSSARTKDTPLLQFEGNTAHTIMFNPSNGLGYAPKWTGIALDLGKSYDNNPDNAPIKDFTAWKTGNIAIAVGHGDEVDIENPTVAEARIAILTRAGAPVEVTTPTIVAETENAVEGRDLDSLLPAASKAVVVEASRPVNFIDATIIGEDKLVLSSQRPEHQGNLTVTFADGNAQASPTGEAPTEQPPVDESPSEPSADEPPAEGDSGAVDVPNEGGEVDQGSDPVMETPTDGSGTSLLDGSATFDGSSDAFVVEHQAAFQAESGSLSFRFKANDTSGTQGLMSKDSKGLDDGGHLTLLMKGDVLQLRAQTESQSFRIKGGSVSAGDWHDVEISWGDDGVQLSLDGAEVGQTKGFTDQLINNLEPIVFGANQQASGDQVADELSNFFSGEIADVRFDGDRAVAGVSATISPSGVVKEINPAAVSTPLEMSEALSMEQSEAFKPKFTAETLESYGGRQDQNLEAKVSDGGNEIALKGNGWKQLGVDYTITPETTMRFEFQSNSEGEIHSIGFDNDNAITTADQANSFQLSGTQEWGVQDFATYMAESGWQSFEIPVGEYLQGEVASLTFGNDHDVANPDAASQFRNIELFEASEGVGNQTEVQNDDLLAANAGTTTAFTMEEPATFM